MMTIDRALNENIDRWSNKEMDAAHRLLGEAKRLVRLEFDLRPILHKLEEIGIVPRDPVTESHKRLIFACKSYNIRIKMIVDEMMIRQARPRL